MFALKERPAGKAFRDWRSSEIRAIGSRSACGRGEMARLNASSEFIPAGDIRGRLEFDAFRLKAESASKRKTKADYCLGRAKRAEVSPSGIAGLYQSVSIGKSRTSRLV